MVWFKVDDKLHSHRKALRAGDAIALWTLAGSWCMDHLTDGFIPDYVAVHMLRRGKQYAATLVEVGFWENAQVNGEIGYQFHDWSEFQPSREKVDDVRAKASERMKRLRSGSPDVRANKRRSSQNVPDTRPDPYPVVLSELQTHPAPAGADGAGFADFWAIYPRKVGRAQAERAWTKALKTAPSQAIISGLREQLPSLAMQRRTDGDYRPHPATWLNGERWADEPPATVTHPEDRKWNF